MKKIVVVALVALLSISGCSRADDPPETADVEQPGETQGNDSEDPASEEPDDEKNPVVGTDLSTLSLEIYDGGTFEGTVFKEKKLTVLNLWGSWCGPCVEEMPAFENAWKIYKDKEVQFVGLALNSEASEVKQLKDDLGITYPLVKENEETEELLSSKFDYVPVTLFVDSEGVVVESYIPGGTTEEALKSRIEALLNEKG